MTKATLNYCVQSKDSDTIIGVAHNHVVGCAWDKRRINAFKLKLMKLLAKTLLSLE